VLVHQGCEGCCGARGPDGRGRRAVPSAAVTGARKPGRCPRSLESPAGARGLGGARHERLPGADWLCRLRNLRAPSGCGIAAGRPNRDGHVGGPRTRSLQPEPRGHELSGRCSLRVARQPHPALQPREPEADGGQPWPHRSLRDRQEVHQNRERPQVGRRRQGWQGAPRFRVCPERAYRLGCRRDLPGKLAPGEAEPRRFRAVRQCRRPAHAIDSGSRVSLYDEESFRVLASARCGQRGGLGRCGVQGSSSARRVAAGRCTRLSIPAG